MSQLISSFLVYYLSNLNAFKKYSINLAKTIHFFWNKTVIFWYNFWERLSGREAKNTKWGFTFLLTILIVALQNLKMFWLSDKWSWGENHQVRLYILQLKENYQILKIFLRVPKWSWGEKHQLRLYIFWNFFWEK
jgi:hypothetical protein